MSWQQFWTSFQPDHGTAIEAILAAKAQIVSIASPQISHRTPLMIVLTRPRLHQFPAAEEQAR